MIFVNKTGFVSDPFNIGFEAIIETRVAITGPGPVTIEQQSEDGVWRTFPDLTFTDIGAYIVFLKGAKTRIAITGGTTVEFNT